MYNVYPTNTNLLLNTSQKISHLTDILNFSSCIFSVIICHWALQNMIHLNNSDGLLAWLTCVIWGPDKSVDSLLTTTKSCFSSFCWSCWISAVSTFHHKSSIYLFIYLRRVMCEHFSLKILHNTKMFWMFPSCMCLHMSTRGLHLTLWQKSEATMQEIRASLSAKPANLIYQSSCSNIVWFN